MARNRSLTKGRWRAYALSILLHSSIVAAAVYGWFSWSHTPPPVSTLAIEASVVDERVVKGLTPIPEPPPPEPVPEPVPEPAPPEPEPAPVEEQGPPKPDPAELERKEAERLAQELKEREDAERLEAEKQAAAKAAAEKEAAEKAAAEKKAAEKKRAEDAAAAKKAAEEKARLARQAELQRALEAEERSNVARNSDDAARWKLQIGAKIRANWKAPPSARAGVECNVTVTQVPGGEVTDVRGITCNIDDAALRESLRDAIYRASPLPPPPVGVPFDRILELTFEAQ